jgi:AraC-like DNA-binding protein/ligand-binding sensor protein
LTNRWRALYPEIPRLPPNPDPTDMIQTRVDFEKSLHARLRETGLFTIYQNAFQNATGLPLELVGAGSRGECVSPDATNHGPFCEVLHCKGACHACLETNQRLLSDASEKGTSSCHCFAGLVASAVPVKAGTSIIGYLKTGQVFTRVPDEGQFVRVVQAIGRRTLSRKSKELLRAAYYQTRTIEPTRYASMLTLLESFAAHLSHHAESLAVIEEGKEPAAIVKARCHVHEHLGEPVILGEVAKMAGLSDSHFCRLFRQVTGLTLTDYVNRCRIEWAKEELLKKGKHVSEIAYHIGYQSISQFNRNFLRITGAAPTAWRLSQFKSRKSTVP